MISPSSLGKTPKTQRWVASDPPVWPQMIVLPELSVDPEWVIHGPFQNLQKVM